MHTVYSPNLSADTLWLERAVLIGDCISQIIYGILVTIFLQVFVSLVSPMKRRGEEPQRPLIAYTCVMFGLGTIFIGTDMRSLQRMFIDNRDFPGGPTAFEGSQFSNPVNILANTCGVLSSLLADGFLLYRCLVIFHLSPYIVAFPILMYMGIISMGVLFLFQTSRPGAGLFVNASVNFGVPYFALSASLNVVISTMISIRLLLFRRSLMQAAGPKEAAAAPYISIAAMITESSMLYTIFSMLFVIPYGLRSHVANIFLPIVSQIQIIAPLLIILRVANRKAWDARTASVILTSVAFVPGPAMTQTQNTSSASSMEFESIAVQLQHGGSGSSAADGSNSSRNASKAV